MTAHARALCVVALCALAVAAMPVSAGGRSTRGATRRHACPRHPRAAHRRCLRRRAAARHAPSHGNGPPASGAPAAGGAPGSPAGAPGTPPAPSPTPVPGGSSGSEGSSSSPPPTVPHVQVTAVEYALALSRTTVPAGPVVLEFVNRGEDEHNLNSRDEGVVQGLFGNARPQAVSDLRVTLRAGTYTFFCSLPEHERKGMLATLTVE